MTNITKEKLYLYEDITEKALKNKVKYKVIKNATSVVINNRKFYVNKRNKIIHKNKEVEIANLLIETLGGVLEYLPEIKEIDNIKCADFLYQNEMWDLKELGKRVTSKTRAVDNVLKKSKRQSNNFILDITKCPLNRDNIIYQVKRIYDKRPWINKIIIFDNNKVLKFYKRKNKKG